MSRMHHSTEGFVIAAMVLTVKFLDCRKNYALPRRQHGFKSHRGRQAPNLSSGLALIFTAERRKNTSTVRVVPTLA